MFSNLKVNKNFKKYTTAVLVTSSVILSGCNIVPDNNFDSEYTSVIEDKTRLDVIVNFDNYDSLSQQDLIIFYDDNGNVLNATYSDDMKKEVTLYPSDIDNINISSKVLNTAFDLPNINNNETFDITIDYATKTYNVEIIKQSPEKVR